MSYKGVSDFRSDTVTRPTEEMRRAMYKAEVGDDVLGDDPTVIKLQERAAEILGKEAALFLPTGTMGNTIAMKIAAGEGKEVILEEQCHIMNFESGNIARICGSLPRPLPSYRGKIPLDVIEKNIHTALREHMPTTRAISLENTHNVLGGAVLEPEYLEKVHTLAQKYKLHVHLDGARLYNAAVALNIEASAIVRHVDSVMCCLSKGLCAPVGSVLAGSREFIGEARFVRKYLGGGMRQAGVIAAAGLIALEKMIPRLAEDHIRAKRLAEMIMDLSEISFKQEEIVTNFLILKTETMSSNEFLKRLAPMNVLALPFSDSTVRFVTHNDIDDNDIERAASAIRAAVKS